MHPELAAKFCPERGKPMWVDAETTMDQAFRVGDAGWVGQGSSNERLVGVILGAIDDFKPWHLALNATIDARAAAKLMALGSTHGVRMDGARLRLALTAG